MILLFDEKYRDVALRSINYAKHYIYIAQFKVDSAGVGGKGYIGNILNALVRKRAEGVKVKVLLDYLSPRKGRAANNLVVAQWLLGQGIEVRYLPRNRCVHAKFMCVDGLDLFLGSHNWTLNSLSRNFELSLSVSDYEVISAAEGVFLALFNSARSFVALDSGVRR